MEQQHPAAVFPSLWLLPLVTGQRSVPVDSIVRRLDGAVHLQRRLVVHIGQRVPLHRLVRRCPPQEGLDAERDELEGAAAEGRAPAAP